MVLFSSVRRILKRGAGTSENLRRTKIRMKIISPKISPIFCPKLGEDHKKKQKWSRRHKARGLGHKKISRPRTDPLAAKAKDQGHRRKCSPKKKKRS